MATSPFLEAPYDSVRRLIDVTMGVEELPDAVVAEPVYLGAAAAEVLALDPEAQGRTGEAEQRVKNATAYLTAALILPALPQLLGERFVDFSATYARQDVGQRVVGLRARAAGDLRQNTGADVVQVTHFALARGRRGR